MKKTITQNYGLKGGTLDATKHVEKAALRSCFPSELTKREQAALQLEAIKGDPGNN